MNLAASWKILGGVATPQPPASEGEIADVEKLIGAPLPHDVRQSLLLHNGLSNPGDALGGWILSCEEMIREWQIWKELYDGDNDEWQDQWWTPNLVSLVADGAGNSLCVDVTTGALVDMDHEMGPNPTEYASWTDYLAQVARNASEGTAARGMWA